jgi:hypothetical protein
MTHFGKGHGALVLLTARFEAQGQLKLLPPARSRSSRRIRTWAIMTPAP